MHIEDLAGKVCLVTGASRGIGAAVAEGLGAAGMRVGVNYLASEGDARDVVAAITRGGGEAILLQGDVSQPGVPERLVDQTVAHFGRIDVLINNAGDSIERCPVADTPDTLFDRHIALNIRPTFAACRAAVARFREQGAGGVIVNLSSIAARTGGGGGTALYAGAKAFIASFTRALAKEVAGDGIRVNAVSPGVIATPMQTRLTSAEQLEAARLQIPLRRIGTVDECVGTFLYLCSNSLSGYLTGQIIEVNGGLAMP